MPSTVSWLVAAPEPRRLNVSGLHRERYVDGHDHGGVLLRRADHGGETRHRDHERAQGIQHQGKVTWRR